MDSRKFDQLMSCRPRMRDGLTVVTAMDDLVIYDGEGEKGVSLNSSARQVWELMDGASSVREISGRIAEGLGISERSAIRALETDVAGAIEQFQRQGLLKPGVFDDQT